MNEEQLEILYDHYKETNQLRINAQKRRDLSFVWCCVLEAVSFFFLIQPGKTVSMFQDLIKNQFGIDTIIGNYTFQTLLWILLAYVMILYVRNMLYVERTYEYQQKLEKELDTEVKKFLFGRESSMYTDLYPNSLNLIDIFYKFLCPILFAGINIYRMITEFSYFRGSVLIDTVICTCLLIILWAHFFDVHPKFEKWCEKYIPLFKKSADGIRSVLKKV